MLSSKHIMFPLVAATLLILIQSGCTRSATPTGQIAFIRYFCEFPCVGILPQSQHVAYIIQTDGTGLHRLIKEDSSIYSTDQYCPVWSPDGTHIAFVSSGLFTVEPDGGNLKMLLDRGINLVGGCPSWSPDGSRLAFTSHFLDDTANEIYLIDIANSALTRLTSNTGLDSSPIWSPDGQHIAFLTDSDTGNDSELSIHLIDVDGNNQRRLVEGLLGYYSHLSMSPDGNTLVFDTGDHVDNPGIFSVKIDSAEMMQLTDVQVSEHSHIWPTWSPSGQYIAFLDCGPGPSEGCNLYVMNPDGSNQTFLGVADGGPLAWSPDGKRIAFSHKEDIYVVDLDGGNLTRLTTDSDEKFWLTWSPLLD